MPSHLSWTYYSKTDPKCGNLVWQTTMHTKLITQEVTPEVGDLIIFPNWMPHFTKKNNSGYMRISIAGNARADEKDYEKIGRDPGMLFNIIGHAN